MGGGERELVEVELDRLDFAVIPDLVAEAEERVLDDPPDLRDRMEVTDGQLLAGQGHVDHLIAKPPVELRVLEDPFALGDRRLEALPDPVHARRAAPARARSSGRDTGRARRRAPSGYSRRRPRPLPRARTPPSPRR